MPRGIILKTVATVAVLGVVGTAAVVAQGFDAQQVPQLETSVWVTRDAGQYGRVNTELAEIDTVRAVADPSAILQSGSRGYVFSQGFSQMWAIDAASPGDLVSADDAVAAAGAPAAVATPALTRQVVAAGDFVLFSTETGETYLTGFPGADGSITEPAPVDPFLGMEVAEGETRPRYVADAAAVDASGRVALFSAAEGGVRVYDAISGRFAGEPAAIDDAPQGGPDVSLTFAGGRWVLSDSGAGLLWIEGRGEPVSTGVEDAVIQAASTDDGVVLLADRSGLVGVDVADGSVRELATASGTPAAPVRVGGVSYAAWISDTGAALWSSDTGEIRDLEVEAERLAEADSDLTPVFRSNGHRAALNETATGLVWTLPDGRLVSGDDWAPLEETVQDEGTVEVDDVIDQQPPVSVDDAFGVRAGSLVSLPLLLNDHDPNKDDVLTIDAASIQGLDPAFGSVSLVADDQIALVQVGAASGSTTFSYAATDGVLSSAPATVTLTVVPEGQNSAPVWCGVEGCLHPWPVPQMAPGGFAAVSVLPGWVDPEGDIVLLADARADDPSAPVTVVPTSDGRVVVRHTDPNASDAVILITVTVSDAFGEQATMPLEVRVTPSPSLTVEPVVVSAGAGEERRVTIADSVTGGSGSYRLIDAVVLRGSTDAFSVTPQGASGEVELSASQPGEYAASYTVQDTQTLSQQTAIIRFSVQASERPLAAPPLTAFVRAGEDATIDVLASVQNTTGRVLLVQDASTTDPQLSVSVIGQSVVRVANLDMQATPGRLGTARVLIADGAGNAVTTTLTVFLLAPTHGVGPIALPDAITVRAGAQIDIPVLANDVSPRGERLLLHPVVEGSGAEDELAFASASRVRYLAPETPGTYTVRYSIYLENDPARVDSATITVSVLPSGANRAPQPGVLSARVLAGQSVSIPVPTGGNDPDGDPTVLADVEQPKAGEGSVSISATGDTLVYRAPANGVRGGQLSFAYTVRDSVGAEGTGTVRVGLLAADVGDVAPIAYSDYVGVQRGSETDITVRPLLNDRDPLQGTLRLVDIRPNAFSPSAEWDRLEALLDRSLPLEDGRVALRAGDVSGINSYVYTVESSSSRSTAEGLIVLGVSDEPSPDSPHVADTIVTVQTRADLERGIDVVAGKVQWPTGDVDALTLSLWRDVPGFSVDGHRISGSVGREARIVPFELTGEDARGDAVSAFGFLRVPAFDDMRVQLSTGADPVVVDEEKSATFEVADFVDVAPGDDIELRSSGDFSVQRNASTCAPANGDRATYTAGREAPWSDTCSVVVRVAGQSSWSVVPVPIVIVPKDPQAILSPVSRTVPPGESVEIDPLADLTTWEGGRVGNTADLDFSIQASAPSFDVAFAGGTIVASARADARPGTRESVRVNVSSFGGLTTTVSLVVGIAAPDAPKGATFTKQCDVSAGPCSITAVGIPGEYDPFAGKSGSGLKLVNVGADGSVNCPIATVSRSDASRMVATWPSGGKPLGGECVVSFTVADAQERTGQGQLTLDILGYPQTPASVVTEGYGPTSVTLRVPLGEAVHAHPSVSGVAIYENGSRVAAECTPATGSYLCVVSGLVNGAEHVYTARAVNGVGESADTSGHRTWAYDAPVVSSVTAEAVFKRGSTTREVGWVEARIVAGADADRFEIRDSASPDTLLATVARSAETTTAGFLAPVGAGRTIVVTPISRYSPPIGTGNSGLEASTTIRVAGSPFYTGGITVARSLTSLTINSPALDANFSPQSVLEKWAVWPRSQPAPQCRVDGDGAPYWQGSGVIMSDSPSFTGLPMNTWYRAGVCGSAGFGEVGLSTTSDVVTFVPPDPPAGPIHVSVSTTPVDTTGRVRDFVYRWSAISVPAPPSGQYETWVRLGTGSWTQGGLADSGVEGPSVGSAIYCLAGENPNSALDYCGAPTSITVSPTGPPYAVRVTFQTECVTSPQVSDVQVVGPSGTQVVITISEDGSQYLVNWGSQFASLPTLTWPVTLCTVPDPDPDPDPDPEDGP
ncbi:Ig-like domain-containing protein [Salinibacterium sp. ZJ77]|uniref:Ig-like domain-containing protein n=1 Tax=Salinibacterium sp. ZJ77 TaxID=2708337 RepID=UPI0014228FE7|nr:Ig-like domain-containing protein [Salinibacterium sp. ZJ77]